MTESAVLEHVEEAEAGVLQSPVPPLPEEEPVTVSATPLRETRVDVEAKRERAQTQTMLDALQEAEVELPVKAAPGEKFADASDVEVQRLILALRQEEHEYGKLRRQWAASRLAQQWLHVRARRVLSSSSTRDEMEALVSTHNKEQKRIAFEQRSLQELVSQAAAQLSFAHSKQLSHFGMVLAQTAGDEQAEFEARKQKLLRRMQRKHEMLLWLATRVCALSQQQHELRQLARASVLRSQALTAALASRLTARKERWRRTQPRYKFDMAERVDEAREQLKHIAEDYSTPSKQVSSVAVSKRLADLSRPAWQAHAPSPQKPARQPARCFEVEQLAARLAKETESQVASQHAQLREKAAQLAARARDARLDAERVLEDARTMLSDAQRNAAHALRSCDDPDATRTRLASDLSARSREAANVAQERAAECTALAGELVVVACRAIALTADAADGLEAQKLRDTAQTEETETSSADTVHKAARATRRRSLKLLNAVADAARLDASGIAAPLVEAAELEKEEEQVQLDESDSPVPVPTRKRRKSTVAESATVTRIAADTMSISECAAEASSDAVKAEEAAEAAKQLSLDAGHLLRSVSLARRSSVADFEAQSLSGVRFLKHGKSGPTRTRTIRLLPGSESFMLSWSAPGTNMGSGRLLGRLTIKGRTKQKPQFLECDSHTKILPGKQTAPLLRKSAADVPEDLCFSVVTGDSVLALQAESRDVRDYWMRHLRAQVQSLPQAI